MEAIIQYIANLTVQNILVLMGIWAVSGIMVISLTPQDDLMKHPYANFLLGGPIVWCLGAISLIRAIFYYIVGMEEHEIQRRLRR